MSDVSAEPAPGPRRADPVLPALAMLAVLLVYAATPWGAGLTNDSDAYLVGARSLATGHGYTLPLSPDGDREVLYKWPPGLSLVLTPFAYTGIDPIFAVRHLNAWLAGVATLLAGLAARRPAALLTAVGLPVIHVASHAWSEPLFIVLSGGALLSAAGAVTSRRPAHSLVLWPAAAGVAAGLAYLTRYAGAATLLTVGLTLLLAPAPWKIRLTRPAVFTLVAVVPIVLWMLRNHGLDLPASGREFTPDQRWPERFGHLWKNLEEWAYPAVFSHDRARAGRWSLWGLLAGAGLVAVWTAVTAGPSSARETHLGFRPGVVAAVFAGFGIIYLLLVTVAIVGFDTLLTFEERRNTAAAYAAFVVAGSAAWSAWTAGGRWLPAGRVVHAAGVWLLLAVAAAQAYATLDWVSRSRTRGTGYASPRWSDMQTLRWLRTLPPDAAVYSDRPQLVRLLTGRPCRPVPRLMPEGHGDHTPEAVADFHAYAGRMTRDLADTGGVVLLFDLHPWRPGTIDPLTYTRRFGLRRLHHERFEREARVYVSP